MIIMSLSWKVLLTFSFLVIHFTCVLHAAVIVQNGSDTGTTKEIANTTREIASYLPQESKEAEERVEISYSSKDFKELDPDVLQVLGDTKNIALSCHSTRNNTAAVEWLYHWQNLYQLPSSSSRHDISIDLSDGPPVARLECLLRDNKDITNNTFIYTGGDVSPYLFRNQRTVRAEVVNESIAIFPCLLNYPVELTENKELQLFKNGEVVENKNNCLNYTPEHGYFVNLTKLPNPLGVYECKVVNSTEDDYIMVELTKASFIQVQCRDNYGLCQSYKRFYEHEPQKQRFDCSAPKSMFNNEFRWYYQLKNGTNIPFEPERPTSENLSSPYPPSVFVDTVYVQFDSKEISSIICASQAKDTSHYFNSSIPVDVVESFRAEIVNDPNPPPIIYQKGKNLSCGAIAEPFPTFIWFKNGDLIEQTDLNRSDFLVGDVKRSTLVLNPKADDKDVNYTCHARNFLGNDSYTFRVKLPEDDQDGTSGIIVTSVLVVLAVIVVLVGAMLACFKVKLTRRRFSREKIDQFFHGSQSNDDEDTERILNDYQSHPFDHSKQIKFKNLTFDEREIKSGNFGKIMFGLYKKGNESIPVAIKTIKNNSDAKPEEVEYAFDMLLNEIKLMQFIGSLGHVNVVEYVGAVTTDIETYQAHLILKYCNKGDLASYLKANKSNFHDDMGQTHQNNRDNGVVLKASTLVKWAAEIANGMEYIIAKRIVHRDLATRNVLLHYDQYLPEGVEPLPESLTAKISDFGLSKNLESQPREYYQIVFSEGSAKRVLPLRWLSIEALRDLKFTPANDVWAYGVTLWEIFTLGDMPYKELLFDDQSFRNCLYAHLDEGNRLREAEFAQSELCEIMSRCWHETPFERPSFADIKQELHAIIDNWRNAMNRGGQNIAEARPSGYAVVQFVPSDSSCGEESDEEDDANQNEINM